MSEWLLVSIFVVLSVTALGVISYPLRQSKLGLLTVIPSSLLAIWFAYNHWGVFDELKAYQQKQANRKLAKSMLAKMPSTDVLIEQLKSKLGSDKKSAHGWYLLGRLYIHQQKWKDAKEAFAMAKTLEPENEQYLVNFIYSIWEFKGRKLSLKERTLLENLLKKNQDQPDALGLLAKDAYDRQDYELARNYWRRLLKLVPANSQAAADLRKAIAGKI